MPTVATVMAELRSKATAQTRSTYIRHGMPADHRTLGVSSADMKLIAKTIKKQQALACELYATGTFEAMYLGGMVADGAQLTPKQLESWVDGAAGMPMIFEHTIPWVTVESLNPGKTAVAWMKSKKEHVAAAGWSTYSGLLATVPDDALNLAEIDGLLKAIPSEIHKAPNRVRAKMNSFVISVGTCVTPLFEQAQATAKQLGPVEVDAGDTACEIPVATDRIAKTHASGRAGIKRKTIRC